MAVHSNDVRFFYDINAFAHDCILRYNITAGRGGRRCLQPFTVHT